MKSHTPRMTQQQGGRSLTLNTAEKNHPKGLDFMQKRKKLMEATVIWGPCHAHCGCNLLGRKLRLERQAGARRPSEGRNRQGRIPRHTCSR